MKDTTRTALVLGGAGGLCGGCISLAYIALTAAAGTLGFWFWGLVAGVPAAVVLVALVALRRRNFRAAEACEVEPDGAAEAAGTGDA